MLQTDTVNQLLKPMKKLQDRWYNGFVDSLRSDPMMAQMVQPSPPLLQSDLVLWKYLNSLPPASLTWNTNTHRGDQFFENYAAVICQQEFPESAFEKDIGPNVYIAWEAHLSTIKPPPSQAQLPQIFRNWAMLNYPEVANIGASDLAKMALIDSAQQKLQPYIKPPARPVNFSGGIKELLSTLSQSGSANFAFDSSQGSGDVSKTWTGGMNTGFYGLWAGSSPASWLNVQFAGSRVKVTGSARHYTVWPSQPGGWYDSGLLGQAYKEKTTPPWPQKPDPSWDEAFNPTTGTMRYLLVSLLIVDELNIQIDSDVSYSPAQQQIIRDNASSGLWPFFVPDAERISKTEVEFGVPSAMRINVVTQPGNPLIIGANVQNIATIFGG